MKSLNETLPYSPVSPKLTPLTSLKLVIINVTIRESKPFETIKALIGLRPRVFITFSVFGTPDETLALVFDMASQMKQ